MTTNEFRGAVSAMLGLNLTLKEAAAAMQELSTAMRSHAEVVAEFAATPRGKALIKRMNGEERYRKQMERRARRVEEAGAKPPARSAPPLNPRAVYDLGRLRMKQEADQRRIEAREARRKNRVTSLPLPSAGQV